MKPIVTEVAFAELMPIIEDAFAQGLTVTLPVTGNSMRPLFLHKRDQVILAACDATTLRRGDVPLYQRANGQFVLHRIVRVYPQTFTLVGDAQTELETGLEKERIKAVMIGFIRKNKKVMCTSFFYRLYVTVWGWLRPLRPYIFAVRRRMRGVR